MDPQNRTTPAAQSRHNDSAEVLGLCECKRQVLLHCRPCLRKAATTPKRRASIFSRYWIHKPASLTFGHQTVDTDVCAYMGFQGTFLYLEQVCPRALCMLVIYRVITNHPKIQQLITTNIYYLIQFLKVKNPKRLGSGVSRQVAVKPLAEAVDPQVLTGGLAGGCTIKVTHMAVSRKLQFPATCTGLPKLLPTRLSSELVMHKRETEKQQ